MTLLRRLFVNFLSARRIYSVTTAQVVQFLIENVTSDKIDPKVSVLANRMFLQIFSVPSLQANLVNTAIFPTGAEDGTAKIQFDFLKLPKEVLPDLERLLSTDFFEKHRLVKYVKDGQARTGLEIEVTPKELPGDAYDYAF